MTQKEKERIRELAKRASARGKSFIKQVKEESDNIIPYDGEDAYYVDATVNMDEDESFDIPVYESKKADTSANDDSTKSTHSTTSPKEENDFVERIKVSVGGKNVESKLGSVIAKGADSFKRIVADVKTRLSNDIEDEEFVLDGEQDSDSSSTKKDRINLDTEKIFASFSKRLGSVNESIDAKMSDIAESTRELKNNIVGTSARYEELTTEIKGVAKTTEESSTKLEDMSIDLDGVKSRVNEIHSTTNSIDKLYDSVFELKATNVELRNKIEYLTKLIKVMGITTISIVCVATIALIVINIIK